MTKHAVELVKVTLHECVNENMEVRDAATDLLSKLMHAVNEGLTTERCIHKDIFNEIIE